MENIKIGKKTIIFDDTDGRHLFTDEKGNRIQSVTGFTGVLDKPALIPWAVNLGLDYLRKKWLSGDQITEQDFVEAAKQHRMVKKVAGDIGTAIHGIVSQWIKNKPFEIPEDEKIRNGFNAFLGFQKEHKAKWLESEKIVYSAKYNYVGIVDAIAIIDKNLTLVDFKSAKSIGYPENYLQTAGYMIPWEEMTKKKIDKRLVIRFGKDDGEFEFIEMVEHKRDKEAFLSTVKIKRAIDSINDRKTNQRNSRR